MGTITEQLIDFIEKSPSCYHAVANMKKELSENGFAELRENQKWSIGKGGRYFVDRNGSSLIAFTIPETEMKGIRIMASHSDSPCLKIKENPEMEAEGHYIKLNVEKYGGMLLAPWFDRPLSAAGRVIVRDGNTGKLQARLVNVDRDFLIIPSLAIHMNRDVNDGYPYNVQKDMLPLYGDIGSKDSFMTQIADAAGVRKEEILGHDLFLYNRQKGCVWGPSQEFVSSGRLDDLQCAFASLKGFLSGEKKDYLAVHCVLDNEEVGSGTKQGAASTFLYDVLTRIHESLGLSHEDYLIHLADSFMISADNAQGVHPNYADKADPVNRPYLNGGIVLKFNASQKYCTDGVSAAIFRDLCERAGVPVQIFVNRSDMAGGSTLGNISNTRVAMNTADIGLAQFAMHSSYETAGARDTEYLVKAARELYV